MLCERNARVVTRKRKPLVSLIFFRTFPIDNGVFFLSGTYLQQTIETGRQFRFLSRFSPCFLGLFSSSFARTVVVAMLGPTAHSPQPADLKAETRGVSKTIPGAHHSPRPVFVPVLSLSFIFHLFFPFAPLRRVSVCIFRFAFVLLLLSAFNCFRFVFLSVFLSAIKCSHFHASLVFLLVAEYVCLCLFVLISLFYTPRKACEPAICEKLRIL